MSAVSHWEYLVSSDDYYGNTYASRFWRDLIKRSQELDYSKKISPYFRAHEKTNPLMIIHGKYDRTVPFEQAKMMQKALKKEGREVDMIEFPNSGHSILGTDNRSRYLEEVKRFIEKNI